MTDQLGAVGGVPQPAVRAVEVDITKGPSTSPPSATERGGGLFGESGRVVAQPDLRAVLEAVLLVVDEPVSAAVLARVVEAPEAAVEAMLGQLATEYDGQGRGFELRSVAGGWRLYSRANCSDVVERFLLDGQQARLSQAALETLAVIAYRQPVTRSRMAAVRGVNVDGVVRTLLGRGLVVEEGAEPATGAILYATSPLFLERLGLSSLDQLPSLAPLLPELNDLDDD